MTNRAHFLKRTLVEIHRPLQISEKFADHFQICRLRTRVVQKKPGAVAWKYGFHRSISHGKRAQTVPSRGCW